MKCHYCVEARDLDTEYCYHWWLEDVTCLLARLIIDNFTRFGHQIFSWQYLLAALAPFLVFAPHGPPSVVNLYPTVSTLIISPLLLVLKFG